MILVWVLSQGNKGSLSLREWLWLVISLSLSLGLKQIHALSIQGNYELRIDLEDFDNSTAYAQYGMFGVGLFSVDPDDDGYPLTVGDYSGNAGTYIWMTLC